MPVPALRRPRRSGSAAVAARALTALSVALIVLFGGACARRGAPPPPEGTPRLVLLVAVDQMRYDYLERVGPLFTGGLARLLATGVSFTDAHHAHAMTSTGPGHATLSTGAHPARHGIVANSWYDRAAGDWVYCVGDPEHDRLGPVQLRVPALGDRMKERWPEARVFAAAGKDRAAILLGGRRADGAFWFDDGEFVTSSYYYRRSGPEWLDEFNDRDWPRRFLAEGWTPLPVTPEAMLAAGFFPDATGPMTTPLPRAFGGFSPAADRSFYAGFRSSPFVDEMLGLLALEMVEAEGLGEDRYPDLLALSFSALDWVGHDDGPNSPATLDVLLRLDRTLGRLLDDLDRRLGEGAVVVALSADHGVAPLPEDAERLGLTVRRAGADDVLCLQRADRELEARFGQGIDWIGSGFYLDAEAIAEHDLDADRVAAVAAGLLERCPMVAHAWTRAQMAADGTTGEDGHLEAYRNGFDPERSPDLMIEVEPYRLPITYYETTHGSPHPYDTHVPLLFAGPGIAPGRVDGRVATVDLAPTLAERIGLPPLDGVDGRSLAPRLGHRTPAPSVPGEPAAESAPAENPSPVTP